METLSVPRTQTEMLDVQPKHQRLFIGIPKETTLQENRVALVPHSVVSLVAHGHKVVVEAGAGEKAKFSDHDYSEAGAHANNDIRLECRASTSPCPSHDPPLQTLFLAFSIDPDGCGRSASVLVGLSGPNVALDFV